MNTKLIRVCLGALLTAACTNPNDNLLPDEPALSDVPVLLSAGIAPGNIEAETRTVVNGGSETTEEVTLSFALANDNNASGTADYSAYGAAFTATRASATGATATSLTNVSTPLYYLANGRQSKITGWYPAGSYTPGASAKVEWTLTGAEDVMTATAQAGTKNNAMPALAFQHKLAQMQVYAYAADNGAKTLWGNITGVTLTGQNNMCTYSLADDGAGTVSFDSGNAASFTVSSVSTALGIGKNNATLLGVVMIEPKTTPVSLNLDVSTASGGKVAVQISQQEYPAGTACKVTLILNKTDILPSAIINKWISDPYYDQQINF